MNDPLDTGMAYVVTQFFDTYGFSDYPSDTMLNMVSNLMDERFSESFWGIEYSACAHGIVDRIKECINYYHNQHKRVEQ